MCNNDVSGHVLVMKEITVNNRTGHTLLCRGDHCVVMLVGFVVVGFHLHSIFSPKHLRVLTVSQEVLIVLLQVPQCQPVLLHPQGLKL